MMKVLVLRVAQPAWIMEIDNDLSSMQEVVGGLIQYMHPPLHKDDAVIVCNEEGKINGSRANRFIYDRDGELIDIIFGDFFICNAPPDSEEFESLTDEQIDEYMIMYNSVMACKTQN